MKTADFDMGDFVQLLGLRTVSRYVPSLEHYTGALGFEIAWQWSDDQQFEGGSPTFACVCRGDVSLFLAHQNQGAPGAWLHLNVASVEALAAMHAEFAASGAKVIEPPADRPWGMREMVVEDLDGNTLRIGARPD